jgi:uncharacterized membrane protein
MIRGEIIKGLDHDPNFRWRGEAVTRIENLSDIVFALAFGMLISAASPPQTMADLSNFLFSIIPVTAAFAVLIGIWNHHFTFFRRYGVADKRIISLNAILLFVVLYLAYPLRFAFDSLFAMVTAMGGNMTQVNRMQLTYPDSGIVLAYFGIGFAIIHALYALMHRHVIKKRALLALTDYEFLITKRSVFAHCGAVIISLFMASIAYFTELNGNAGFLMALLPIVHMIKNRKYTLPAK